MAKALVIFLHGVGSNGDDLAVLGQHWSSLLPDVAFASPNAPFPFEHAMGYQWFSLTGITRKTVRRAYAKRVRPLMRRYSS
jgi:Predicted esterase